MEIELCKLTGDGGKVSLTTLLYILLNSHFSSKDVDLFGVHVFRNVDFRELLFVHFSFHLSDIFSRDIRRLHQLVFENLVDHIQSVNFVLDAINLLNVSIYFFQNPFETLDVFSFNEFARFIGRAWLHLQSFKQLIDVFERLRASSLDDSLPFGLDELPLNPLSQGNFSFDLLFLSLEVF